MARASEALYRQIALLHEWGDQAVREPSVGGWRAESTS